MASCAKPTTACHVAAMPFPGRGHINPMMNLCKFLASRKPDILITFVVTEEWLGYVGSEPKPDNVRFATIPNVVPPERLKAADFPAFYEAVMTKMEEPFERLLDRIEPPPSAIVADVEVLWGVHVGKRRNIPVALFWTMSVSFFAALHYFNLFARDNLPLDSLAGFGRDKQLEHIPGLSSSQVADLRTVFRENDENVLKLALECISQASKAQYLLFTSVYELEFQATDALRAQFPFPLYPIGPAIPYLELLADRHSHAIISSSSSTSHNNEQNYFQWLDSQPKGSVLYISLGSFLSVSSAQMDEIAAGLRGSGVRFLWVARSDAARLKEFCGDAGLVLPWCDQLRVLCHPSVGGFWTHCGWNSTLEAVFGGVPMLAFPLFLDQVPNSTQIVEEWKVGLRVVERHVGNETMMTREEVGGLVKRFMDNESVEGKEMWKRGRELVDFCTQAIAKGGSSDTNLNAFIRDISASTSH